MQSNTIKADRWCRQSKSRARGGSRAWPGTHLHDHFPSRSICTGQAAGVSLGQRSESVCQAKKSSTEAQSEGKGGVVREQVVFDAFLLINFVLQQTAVPLHCAFGSSLTRHDSQAVPQVRTEMKISEGGKYLDENLKRSQAAEWQPVHACFFRRWTGSYYWCLLLGATHTDELNVVNLLGARGVPNSPPNHHSLGTHLSAMQAYLHEFISMCWIEHGKARKQSEKQINTVNVILQAPVWDTAAP